MRADKVNELAPKKQKTLQIDIDRISAEINKLDSLNEKLNEEIAKRPTITAQNKSVSTGKGLNANGVIDSYKGQTVTTINLANPRIRQVETNIRELDRLHKELEKKSDKKATIEEDLLKDLEKRNGFLEELEAMVKILSASAYALGFWLILFLFLMSLELFVLFAKTGDKESDYDMVVKHQLEVRRRALQKVLDNQIKDK